jgi:hypothetical protein
MAHNAMDPEKTFTLTESELCLILSALVRFKGNQVRWATEAEDRGQLKEVTARGQTMRKILDLMERIA